MKIGVLGLRPRQIDDMQKRKLKGDFYFFGEKNLSAPQALSFAREMDVLFVQNAGMPKTAIQAVPRGEDTYFNVNMGGSISSLLSLMEEAFEKRGLELYEEQAPTQVAEKGKKAVKTSAPVTATAATTPTVDRRARVRPVASTLGDLLVDALKQTDGVVKLTSVVPNNRTSEYERPEAELYVNDGSGTSVIERKLLNASIGEVLRFNYGKVDTFSARLTSVRSTVDYMQYRHSLIVEAHLYDEFVDIQVMTPQELQIKREEKPAETVFLRKPAVPEAEPVAEEVKPAAPLVTTTVAMPPAQVEQSIASDVPEGRRSQYLLPKHDIVINYPNSGGVQNYSILQAAVPGDVVRFARPEGLSLSNWRGRIGSMRHYQWRHKGILLEAHFYNEYVDIKVMHIDESQVPANTDNWTIQERAEPANEPRDMGERTTFAVPADGLPAERVGAEFDFDDASETADKGVTVEVHTEVKEVAPANVEVVPTAEAVDDRMDLSQIPNPDAETEALGESGNIADWELPNMAGPGMVEVTTTFTDSTKAERKFWRIIFLSEFDIEGDIEAATAKADAALKIHRERFR